MGVRRRAREQSLQFLYQIELKYDSFDISNLNNEENSGLTEINLWIMKSSNFRI